MAMQVREAEVLARVQQLPLLEPFNGLLILLSKGVCHAETSALCATTLVDILNRPCPALVSRSPDRTLLTLLSLLPWLYFHLDSSLAYYSTDGVVVGIATKMSLRLREVEGEDRGVDEEASTSKGKGKMNLEEESQHGVPREREGSDGSASYHALAAVLDKYVNGGFTANGRSFLDAFCVAGEDLLEAHAAESAQLLWGMYCSSKTLNRPVMAVVQCLLRRRRSCQYWREYQMFLQVMCIDYIISLTLTLFSHRHQPFSRKVQINTKYI